MVGRPGPAECGLRLIGNGWSLVIAREQVLLGAPTEVILVPALAGTGTLDVSGLAPGPWEIRAGGELLGVGGVCEGVAWQGVPVGDYELRYLGSGDSRVVEHRSVRR